MRADIFPQKIGKDGHYIDFLDPTYSNSFEKMDVF